MNSQWNNSAALLSVAAISALALSACADNDLGDDDDAEPTPTVTETVESEPTEEPTEEPTAETTDDAEPTEDATGSPQPTEETTGEAEPTEEATGSPEADATETGDPQADGSATGDDEPLYQAVDAVEQEYPDAVVLEFDTEDSHYEFTILDGDTEWELDVDRQDFTISNAEEDDVDSDDQRKADAVEIDFSEALRTAEDDGGGTPEEAELDEENDTVVWEIELDNGTDVYVDVATGEVANVED